MARLRAPRWWLLPAVVAAGLALWQTAGVWGPDPVPGDDTMAQLVRNTYGMELLARGRLDGWFPRFMLGHQLFLFFGPGFTMVLGILRLTTLGLVSTAGAYKAAGVLGIAALGPAALFLARSLGLRRTESAAGSVLVLVVNSPFGLGLHGTYVIGLVPHQVAACFFCVALGSFVRTIEDPRRRWVVLGAVSLAAVAITHPITALVFAAFLVLVVLAAAAHGALRQDGVVRLGVTGVAAVALTGFWSVPFIAHRDLQGPVTAWATPPLTDRAAELARGDILWPAPVSALALAGAAVCAVLAVTRARRWLAFLALGPASYLAVAHLIAARLEGAVSLQLANRGLGHAGVVAMLAAGVAVGTAVRSITGLDRRRQPAHSRRPSRGDAIGAVALAAMVAAMVVVAATVDARRLADTAEHPVAELREVATVLAGAVPVSARFATERDFPAEIARTGTVHPDLWLAATSGRNTLNLFNPESSPSVAGFAAERIGRESPEVSAETLSRYGVTHVVTVRPDTTERFERSGRFETVSRHGDLGVFALRAWPGRPPPAALLAPVEPIHRLGASAIHWSAETIVLDVDAPQATTATVALSWSPKWQARIDGRPVALAPDRQGVISVRIPEGRHQLVLRFGNDGWDRLGLAVTAATLVAGLGYSVSLMSRRRSRTA